jgi:hypothetical protein
MANWQYPRQHRWKRALSNNALVAGVISAIVAGVISLLITHYQDQDAAAQVRGTEQTAAALQLETAATNLERATMNLLGSCSTDPGLCADPPSSYFTEQATFDTERANVVDPAAGNLAAQLENDADDAITLNDTTGDGINVTGMVTAYQQLITRCGQLIQGQA